MGKRVFALLLIALIAAVSILFVKEPAVAAPIFQLSIDNISHGGLSIPFRDLTFHYS